MRPAGATEVRSPRFRLIPFDQIALGAGPRYLVREMIPAGGLTVVWGAPKNGKSFWTMDLALHVALGTEYRGRRVQQGPVVYVAAEGGSGFPARIEAFRQRFLAEDHGPVPFFLLAGSLEMVADHADLIAACRVQTGGLVPTLITIDTLNRTFAGSESSDEDMTAYVRAAVALQEAFGCAVIIVHHCGLDGTRPRGHSSLTGAVDSQISVVKDGDTFTATVEYMKDGPEGAAVTARLEVVTVGLDEDGEEITSCVVGEAEAEAAKPRGPKLTRNQQTSFTVIQAAGASGLTLEEWNTRTKAAGVGLKRHADLYDIREALKAKQLVHSYGDRWYVSQ